MLNPEWGVINTTIFKLTGLDGPNWLNDPTLALGFSMLMHIWKSLPFWTLILLAGGWPSPASSTRPPASTAPRAGRSSASSPGRR
jgi:multiple sugar transport system permease protein